MMSGLIIQALSEMIAYKNKKLQQLQSLFNDLKTGENVRDYVSAIA